MAEYMQFIKAKGFITMANSDPRYGDTTYELTNISMAPPDPALFEIPSDYTVAPVAQ